MPRPNIRRWLTCDCGKRHTAAGASENSLCACGRRLGQRLWSDAAEQAQPEPQSLPPRVPAVTVTPGEVLAALFAYEPTEDAPDFSGSVDAAGNEWPA